MSQHPNEHPIDAGLRELSDDGDWSGVRGLVISAIDKGYCSPVVREWAKAVGLADQLPKN